jgi:galactokinase
MDSKLTLADLVERTASRFQMEYGRPPRWITAAPGRVNLIGEHTDYNGGFVLPMAIERYVVAAADRPGRNRDADSGRVFSTGTNQWAQFSLNGTGAIKRPSWAAYVQGVFSVCEAADLHSGPLDVLIDSTVPLGGGLSSSAALEVATATLIEAVTGHTLDRRKKALLCQKAEHEYAGVPCGIMDQFSAVMGQADHLMLLDCRSTEVEMVPLSDPAVSVLIINSHVKHELTGGEYSERRRQCEAAANALGVASLRDATRNQLEQARASLDDVLYRRARHVISEIHRTIQAAQAIRAGNWDEVGQLMFDSHQSIRDDYEVSCPELDLLVELARRIGPSGGVIGSRMTGAGFGGCTVSLVRTNCVESVAAEVQTAYQQKTNIEPALFTTRPAQGAQIIQAA